MIGGLRLVTKGESSRQGEVSRELAVLEPPPPLGEWTFTGGVWKSSANKRSIITEMKPLNGNKNKMFEL